MERQIYYNIFAIRRDGRKELVAISKNEQDAHKMAKQFDAPYTIIQIEKSSSPFFLKSQQGFST